MTIRTTCELYDSNSNKILKGNTEHNILEQNFDTHAFHCDAGSVVILTEYSQREIKTFGGLDAKEVSEKGDNGLPIILIEERTGHWSHPKVIAMPYEYADMCSCCREWGKVLTFNANYCPNCGARMEDEG